MQRFLGLFLAGLFLSHPAVAWAQQDSHIHFPADSSHPTNTSISQRQARYDAADCSSLLESAREAKDAVERDRIQLSGANGAGTTAKAESAGPFPSDLRQDLIVLQQREAALERCRAGANRTGDDRYAGTGCSADPLLNFQASHDGEPEQEIPILRLPGKEAFFYISGMTIDADGAPNAYHPNNSGLDDLANAGAPGNWEGLAKNSDGEPFVQGPDDPYPGYYVSATALSDRSLPVNNPMRYVDASKIPYIVLPGGLARRIGARPGDFSVVMNLRNGRSSFAIFGDLGPSDRIGEGSIALAENLGIHSDARIGGVRRGILYLVFPGSGNGRPRTVEEINSEGEQLLRDWGGAVQLVECAVQQPARPAEEMRNTN